MDFDRQLQLLQQLESQNQWDSAESLCIKLLKQFPQHANLLVEAAKMALVRSSPAAAESLLYRSLAIAPLNAAAYLSLGMVRYSQNDLEDAERFFRKALLVKPQDSEAKLHLGMLLNELGRFQDAIVFLTGAHQISHGTTEASRSLADALFGAGQNEAAYNIFKQIIELNSDEANNADIRISMGAICETLDRMDEAFEHLSRAQELAPDNPKVYLNLGGVYQRQLKLDKALGCYKKALALFPGYPTARWNICQIKLLQGQFTEGFGDFDSRFDSARPVRLRTTGLPTWDGTASVGSRILVQGEQAFGDTIQFARYIPLLAEKGLKVILENRLSALNSLLLSLAGLEGIIDDKSGNADCEYTIPLQSLPQLFSTTFETIPCRVPYLAPAQVKTDIWRQRLAGDTSFKIGICWAGRTFPDHRRSISAGLLSRLNIQTDISWYSLQIDESDRHHNNNVPGLTPFIDLSPHIHDFEDTAALINCLDLVITIDSAVAHLAGSLGAPTWVLLPYAPDWRWMLDRNDSPWYPTMRIFRQPRPDAWLEVLENVTTQLQQILRINKQHKK